MVSLTLPLPLPLTLTPTPTPRPHQARAYDPLNNDTRLGEGDELQITFDRPTNGLHQHGALLSNRTYVDRLLQWWDLDGAPLELHASAAYFAEWRDASSLVVRLG